METRYSPTESTITTGTDPTYKEWKRIMLGLGGVWAVIAHGSYLQGMETICGDT